MHKIILFIILLASNLAFADSSSFSVDSQLPDCHLITTSYNQLPSGIGLKPSDLTLTDAWENSFLFSASGEDDFTKESDKGCCTLGSFSFKKPKNSWVVTEPLGGIAGIVTGGLAGAIAGLICISPFISHDGSEDFFGLLNILFGGFAVGATIGIPTGIWLTGKHIEKEKGSWKWAMLGSAVGTGCVLLINKINNSQEDISSTLVFLPQVSISLPFISSLVFYRLSLKK
ncbi:MAG: hypothetical protein PHX21_01325 [bacterium]|nr:hypothetical protein [bacterium]